MKKYNILQEKSFYFALEIVNACDILYKEKSFIIGKQLLKSGTSIGANVEETIGASSTKDFLNKLSISYKEAREANFWLRISKHTQKLPIELCDKLLYLNTELQKLLALFN